MPSLAAVLAWALVLLPFAAAAALLSVPRPREAGWGNLAAAALGLLLCLGLLAAPRGSGALGLLRADALALWLLLPGSLLGLTAALFATAQPPPVLPAAARGQPVLFQLLLGTHHLALLADHPGLCWLALAAAVLAAAGAVALSGDPAALRAARRMAVLCGAGLALALFGTVLLILAVPPEAAVPLSWAALRAAAPGADAGLLNLGWVFLLLGYGTMAGLVPLPGWLPAAQAAAPASLAPLLAGLLPVAALHAVLRAAAVPAAAAAALPPGPWLAAFGLAALLLAAALPRGGDARHLLGWAGNAQIGLAALGFGLGAPAAGLVQLAGQALLRGAALFALGRAATLRGDSGLAGLVAAQPALGWGLGLALAGLAGLPPFAPFFAELGLGLAAARVSGWWLPFLLLGLLAVGAALAAAMQALHAAPPAAEPAFRADWAVLGPLWLHLALAVLLGLAAPPLLAEAAAVLR
ncbi:proton-conducting transporter membrane subunit [Roseomonas sp. BN140053]|uniref:proton-conducting transporter transmembrane domain-containing protein n=1 Tax=Roseomonas sp. BN140053 TaxID=3391898 RepID=UPI0039ECE326